MDGNGHDAQGGRDAGVDVSVVIPCYACGDHLAEQLDALADQRFDRRWEVLVADNGGNAGIEDIVAPYRARIPGLRVVDVSSVKGSAHARNAGARAARGSKLLFPDADDIVAPGYVDAMARALDEHQLVACRLEYERLNDPAVLRSRGQGQVDGLRQYRDPPYLPHASGTSLGVRREAHERIGGFDEAMPNLQDTDYCWRLQLEGVSLEFVPDASVHYRLRDDARAVFRQARRYGRYNVLLYKKYRQRGMPPASLRVGIRRWYHLLRSLPGFVRREEQRLRWIRNLAWSYGRLEGCVVYRVFAP